MKRTMKLEDIIVRESFANTTPREYKMKECRDYWDKQNKQDRYIVVDRNNVLVDGYIQYLILKENGIEDVEIRIGKMKKLKRWQRKINKDSWDEAEYREKPTTYIFGVHPNSNCTKEFCWRVPASWGNWADNIEVGDTVLCQTKFGYSPVVVNRVEVLDKPPVDMRVKKVIKREIRRNGMIVEV